MGKSRRTRVSSRVRGVSGSFTDVSSPVLIDYSLFGCCSLGNDVQRLDVQTKLVSLFGRLWCRSERRHPNPREGEGEKNLFPFINVIRKSRTNQGLFRLFSVSTLHRSTGKILYVKSKPKSFCFYLRPLSDRKAMSP